MIFMHGWRHLKAIRSGPGHGELVREPRPEARPAPRVDRDAHRADDPVRCSCSGSSRRSRTAGCAALMIVALAHQPPEERLLPEQCQRGLRVRRHRRRRSRSRSAPLGRASGRSTTPSTSCSRSTPGRRCSSPRSSASVARPCSSPGSGARRRRTKPPPDRGTRGSCGPDEERRRSMGRVALDHVSKRFDDVAAVDDLTLEVADEEFLVLLGPSGCGKSTALRMIAGLEEPTEGTIPIGDRVVNDVEAKDRDVAMVFQSYALYPHMTVRRNIEFPLRSRKVPAAEREPAGAGRGREPRARRAARPQARAALRRSAPAGGAGARDRAPPAGLPHGRAAVEPRRQAAGADPRRAGRAAAAARGDVRLRHPRPGRGDDDGAPDRDDERRRAAAGRRRRRTSTRSRRTSSSPASSGARR